MRGRAAAGEGGQARMAYNNIFPLQTSNHELLHVPHNTPLYFRDNSDEGVNDAE